MIRERLLEELNHVAFRYRQLRLWQLLSVAWLAATIVGCVVWELKFAAMLATVAVAPLVVAPAVLFAAASVWFAVQSARNERWVASQVEAAFPELKSCLLAAVEQQPDLPDGRFGYLQSSVIRDALGHARKNEWRTVVSGRRIALAAVANCATFGLFLLVLSAVLFSVVPPPASATASSAEKQERLAQPFAFTIEPGDAEVERGSSLLVLARIDGPMPKNVVLVYSGSDGEERRVALSPSLDDPLFGGRIPAVESPLAYHVELDEHVSETFHVKVFEYPRLERADARLVFPKYTGLDERLVQDVRTISVVEGTEVTLTCLLNKPVAQATLAEANEPPITMKPAMSDRPEYETTLVCNQSHKWKLELLDEAGRKNLKSATFVIQVTPNRPAAIKPVFPARDLEVSPLEELHALATVWDDFGLSRYGITYSIGGNDPREIVLGENSAAKQKHEMNHVIRLEELKAEPDQLLSYYWWAEDFDAAGSLRRIDGDMYFAEVRPFDEIFRQGEQPPGGEQQPSQEGQNGNAQAAQELAQLQKEIINATWKVVRREITQNLTAEFQSDVEQIHLSQAAAIEKSTALGERLSDPKSQGHLEAVIEHMSKAAQQLKQAHDTPGREPLRPALAAEQSAYQALLKLRAREHEIVRQQQRQQSSSQSNSRSQQQRQQFQQLDVREEENRYETQRQAQEQQEPAEARENRQMLNRLRELAQRQHDLNERLKELQSSLEKAQTEEQKEELQRQLKRLQEEQRQILQDTEELQSRMESTENQERMADVQQQVEQTREQVQRASESLEQTKVTQAAASGARAEQNFEELRDEFRRRAANRFNEEVQQMRQAARELDEREQKISEELKDSFRPDKATKSLRDTNDRERVATQLNEQKERLTHLQEQMRQTIQDAEQTEPLLSERLYDAARGAMEQNLEQVIDTSERAVRQGLAQDATQLEQAAARGISQLRQGIEKAAEAVIGDENEALRRAKEELKTLSRELNSELARNAPEQGIADERNAQQPQPGQPQPGQPQPGQPQPGQPQPGQPQPGQPQPGQPQPGQPQPGRPQPGRPQPGQPQPGQPQPGQPQPGQPQPGQPQLGQPQPGQPQPGQPQPGQPQPGQPQPGQPQPGQPNARGEASGALLGGVGPFENYTPSDAAPLTGERFREWSDRLRDVEEMVNDPELRAEAARIRERARDIRVESKRHSAPPNWELVRVQVAEPLVQLRNRVAEELLRRTAKQANVPLDRDPVPPKYSEKTRLYYERLGSGK